MGETIYRWGGQRVRVNLARVHKEIAHFRAARTGFYWNLDRVAAMCGISPRTLRRFLAGAPVSASTVHLVLSGLRLDAAEVLTYLKGDS
jgi:AraC-like DNA-binding protein